MTRDDMMFGFSLLRHNYQSLHIVDVSASLSVIDSDTPSLTSHITPSAPADPSPSLGSGSLRDEMRGRVTRVTGDGPGETKMKTLLLPAPAHSAVH